MTELTILPPASVVRDGLATTPTALLFQRDYTFDELCAIEPQFRFAAQGLPWWRGDFYNYMEDRFPDDYTQLVEEDLTANQTIANNQSVCRQYAPGERRVELSFSHHAVVAYMDDHAQRARMLTLAIDNKWSVSKLRAEYQALEMEVEEKSSDAKQATDSVILELPILAGHLLTVAEEHLPNEEVRLLYDWLGERLGLSEEPDLPPEPEEPWGSRCARLIREALTEIEGHTSPPSTYALAATRLANWVEAEQGQSE